MVPLPLHLRKKGLSVYRRCKPFETESFSLNISTPNLQRLEEASSFSNKVISLIFDQNITLYEADDFVYKFLKDANINKAFETEYSIPKLIPRSTRSQPYTPLLTATPPPCYLDAPPPTPHPTEYLIRQTQQTAKILVLL